MYFYNHRIEIKGNFKNNKLHGVWEENFYNSKKIENFKEGRRSGFSKFFFKETLIHKKLYEIKDESFEYYWVNLELGCKENYKNGYLDGDWESYDLNGNALIKTQYKNGKITDNQKVPLSKQLSSQKMTKHYGLWSYSSWDYTLLGKTK